MPQDNRASLWNALSASGELYNRFLWGVDASVGLGDLLRGSALGGRGVELRGRSVLIATRDQLTAALALIELDGVVRRMVLCPSDLSPEHLPYVMESGGVDAIVSDCGALRAITPNNVRFITCGSELVATNYARAASVETEWVLLTSGTSGVPKLVVHNLGSLAGAISSERHISSETVWSTFYDIRRYGGLQIFLRAVLGGRSFVLSNSSEGIADSLFRMCLHGVTHVSGTPSHWRRVLMSPFAQSITPQYVRLSGEIADQAILNHLKSFYYQARVAHAFASTEAGVAFAVNDGLAGFPASVLRETPGVDMKIEDGSLRIRSNRTAAGYLGHHAGTLRDADGFVDTADMIELREGRCYFVGRRDGVINIGGQKVHPEEVEAVLNRHPQVRMSLVRTRKNPITGALVIADVVLENEAGSINGQGAATKDDILQFCRKSLPPHKVPAAISFVHQLAVAETGKLVRRSA